jgi:hypothetical protein
MGEKKNNLFVMVNIRSVILLEDSEASPSRRCNKVGVRMMSELLLLVARGLRPRKFYFLYYCRIVSICKIMMLPLE